MRFSAKYPAGLAALAVAALAGCGGAAASSHQTPKTSVSAESVPTGDLRADQTIKAQGLAVTWDMTTADMAGTQITGAALSNTTAGPDMYVLFLATPAAATELAGTMQGYVGPYTDAQGNDVGSVSIQVNGFEVIVSTDSTPAMSSFINALKH